MATHPATPYIAAVTGLVMLAWIIWGVRQYLRTRQPMWLWMVVLMFLSLTVALSGMLR